MDVHQKLDAIAAAVRQARSMPMSASCVINRGDLLARLDEVREALPGSLAQAQEVLGGREQVVAGAQQEAERIVATARAERASLVEGTQVVQEAQAEAGRLLDRARREAEEVRGEADDYVDSKLANFEVVLGKTIASVDRGRDKLLGRDVPAEQLLNEADAYVDAQFAAIEAVLRKTLEAVGRGRQKLTGHRPSDDLGEYSGDLSEGYPRDFLGETPATPDGGAPGHHEYPGVRDDYAPPAVPQPGPGGYGYPEHAAAAAYPGQGYPQQSPDGYPMPAAADGAPYPGAAPYGYPQATGGEVPGYPAPARPAAPGAALDETSLFDTGMIDAEQLRRYEQGR